jgi:hypothetical protein
MASTIGCVLFSASELEQLTDHRKRYLWMQMGKLGYRRREPAELDIPPEEPTLLQEVVDLY